MKDLLKRDEAEEGDHLLQIPQSSINLIFRKTLRPDVLAIAVEGMRARSGEVSGPGKFGEDALDILEYDARMCQSRGYDYFMSPRICVN